MADVMVKSIGENPVKMLINTTPTVLSAVNSELPSPTGEVIDEHPNKLITYLHQLAGNCEIETDMVGKDHCYARPYNWKAENIYVKPVKKLFFSKTQNIVTSNNQEFINIEENDPEPPVPPCDLSKVRQNMDEFQRVANFVRPEDTEDWEEKIDKVLWSPVQNRIFNRVIRILNSERIARLAKAKSLHEPILRRTSIDTTAKRFRESLASTNWDWRIAQWLHSLLFDYLPQEYLAIYLDILQTLRQKVPQLIDKIIAVQPNINSKGSSVTWETLGPLLKKSWDPVSPALNANKPKKLPGNPILVVIPNGMSMNISSRHHKLINQLGNLGMVITINSHLGLTANRMTVIAGLEQFLQTTRAKLQDVRVDYPGRPIILVGLNSGAALACQVAQMEHLTAVICLGFPFNTVDGKRGTPDDTLLDIRCPVMFVIGQNSMLARIDDIEDLRERMLVPTSLIVVGSADDYLRISTSKKISERISQSMVDRCILDEIGDFVGGILLQPHPLPLRSPNSINNYENKNRREGRKRKNSTSSSVDSEPQSPNVKKQKPQSPQLGTIVANNVTNITTNMLPRGTLVTLTGTTATQTPRRQSKTSFANQNFSDQLITTRLTPKQNLDSSAGGITLNIGSFASLAPVGPIRFEPTSISLQTPSTGRTNNALKTSNTFIKVAKNNKVNLTGSQNVTKIKMIMPTKKTPQGIVNNYKNVNTAENSTDTNLVTNTSLRIATPTATVTNSQSINATAVSNTLPTLHPTKNPASTNNVLLAKTTPSSSILFTPKNSIAATTTTTSAVPAKVVDISAAGGGSRKHSMFRSYHEQDQLPNSNNISSLTGLPIMPKRPPKNQPISKISLNSFKKSLSESEVHIAKKNLKIHSGSTNTILELTPNGKTNTNNSFDDDLGNILDIPIIIAKDGENLNNLERLSPLPQTPVTLQSDGKSLPVMNSTANKLVIINNKNVGTPKENQQYMQPQKLSPLTLIQNGSTNSAQPTIKYTKIILTKRDDQEDTSSAAVFTKTKKTNNLVIIDSQNFKNNKYS